jgi:hypothetical protein
MTVAGQVGTARTAEAPDPGAVSATSAGRRLISYIGDYAAKIGVVVVLVAPKDRDRLLVDGLAAKRTYWDEFVLPAKEHHLSPEGRSQLDAAQDVISVLLDEDPSVDDDTLVRNCILYVVAAINTTAAAVVHAVDRLLEWFVGHPEDRALRTDRHFLRRAAGETLQIYPPSPGALRRAERDATTPSGPHIADGELCILHVSRANLDEERFGECPADFNPNRDVSGAKPYGHTFGGRHTCIGRPLALPSNTSPDEMTDGVIVKVLRTVFEAGVEADPERPPKRLPSARGPARSTRSSSRHRRSPHVPATCHRQRALRTNAVLHQGPPRFVHFWAGRVDRCPGRGTRWE